MPTGKRRSNSVTRLLFPYPDAAGDKWSGWRKQLSRKRQDDRRIRFRSLSSGIPVVRRSDLYRRHDGVVYQQDLGKKTGVVATAMKKYDPGAGWHTAEEAHEDTARVQETK